MSKSLSDLRNSPDVGLPERTVNVCLSAKLARELEQADEALFTAESELESARQDAQARLEGEAKPLRMGEKSPVPALEEAAEEAAKRSDEIRGRMKDASAALLLRGKSNGEWRQWANAHPARDEEEEPQGYTRDARWAGGFCNIDALIADLHLFVGTYNDEAPSEEWARFVSDNGVPADLTNAASVVVGMHEQVVDLGKSRVAWRSDRRSVSDSE